MPAVTLKLDFDQVEMQNSKLSENRTNTLFNAKPYFKNRSHLSLALLPTVNISKATVKCHIIF